MGKKSAPFSVAVCLVCLATSVKIHAGVALIYRSETNMSPIGQVHGDVPPMLICDGEKDPIVPGLQGRGLYEKLRAAGANPVHWMTPNGGHAFPGGQGFDQVLDVFLARSLKPDAN